MAGPAGDTVTEMPEPFELGRFCAQDAPTGEGPSAAFGMGASFVGEQAVLAVHGEIDVASVPELGAFFDGAIARGYLSVGLDLAELDVIDVVALQLFALQLFCSAASRLVASSPQMEAS